MTTTKTDHPHIVKLPGVTGGQPSISGSRVSVATIARLLKDGAPPTEIVETFDHISPGAIYDAISYYYDHTDEIEGYLADNTWQAVLDRHNARVVEGRVVFDDHVLDDFG